MENTIATTWMRPCLPPCLPLCRPLCLPLCVEFLLPHGCSLVSNLVSCFFYRFVSHYAHTALRNLVTTWMGALSPTLFPTLSPTLSLSALWLCENLSRHGCGLVSHPISHFVSHLASHSVSEFSVRSDCQDMASFLSPTLSPTLSITLSSITLSPCAL